MLTSEQFDRTRRLALRLAGIELFERHREVLNRKIRRLGMHSGTGFDALLNSADAGDAKAIRRMIGLLTTNFSGFFRHPQHFDLAAEQVLRTVHRRGASRVWSAAASTGEEPYSLAMSLIEMFQGDKPAVTILATDIDEDALAVARQGQYGEPAVSALTAPHRNCFFSRIDARRWHINQTVRNLVEFRVLNLNDLVWPDEGPFDVVFCRNVLMYLDASHRYSVLERLASVLAPDGILMLDPTEHTGKADHWFTRGTNGVYSRRSPSRNTSSRAPVGPTRAGHKIL